MLAQLSEIEKHYGSSVVFASVNERISENDKIGLIGVNGSGKSTLLKIIAGEISPDSGGVSFRRNISIGYLRQDLGLNSDNTVYAEALSVLREVVKLERIIEQKRRMIESVKGSELSALNLEYTSLLERFGQSRGFYYKSVVTGALKGLGYEISDHQKKISTLSGGQKMRVALAKILIEEPDLILLDEPTNYLDVKSMTWLENFLAAYKKSYVIVSHDRYFLEKTTNRIWELDDDGLHTYKGNYSAYVRQRDAEIYARQKAYALQTRYIERQREIIARLKSFNREKSVRRAESREKMLAKIERAEKPAVQQSAHIGFSSQRVISSISLSLRDVSIGYGDHALVSGINFTLKTGGKLGICGDNAVGKTTLLKTIMGEISPLRGDIKFGAGVKPAYFKQEHEDLDEDHSILDELALYSGKDTLEIRSVLGGLLFSGQDVYKALKVLSGGERARVAAAKLMLSSAGLLLLDEPTNHLDITSKEMIEAAISRYEASALIVSHDRYLLSSTADCILYFFDGKCYFYDCGYDEARALFPQTAQKETQSVKKVPKSSSEKNFKTALSKNKAAWSQNRILEIESILEEKQAEKIKLEHEINTPDFYKDRNSAVSALDLYDALKDEIRFLEDEWVDLADQLENN